jgi:ubiquinone/menaquinone biosynthesis C-methylase UbiE
MFHHLEAAEKVTTLREVRRVLKPGARFHLLDFATPDSNSAGRIARRFHSTHRLKDNSDERILSLTRQAGLSDSKRVAGRSLLVDVDQCRRRCVTARNARTGSPSNS